MKEIVTAVTLILFVSFSAAEYKPNESNDCPPGEICKMTKAAPTGTTTSGTEPKNSTKSKETLETTNLTENQSEATQRPREPESDTGFLAEVFNWFKNLL